MPVFFFDIKCGGLPNTCAEIDLPDREAAYERAIAIAEQHLNDANESSARVVITISDGSRDMVAQVRSGSL